MFLSNQQAEALTSRLQQEHIIPDGKDIKEITQEQLQQVELSDKKNKAVAIEEINRRINGTKELLLNQSPTQLSGIEESNEYQIGLERGLKQAKKIIKQS